MTDYIKLPENNYTFKKVYGDDKIKLEDRIDINPYYKTDYDYNRKDINYTSQDYKPKEHSKLKDISKIDFCDKEVQRTYKFELDMFKLSDYEFVNWANQRTNAGDFLIMAVMAEMKQSPKLRDEIERLRGEVYKIPLMPVHEYKKKRKLGDRYASFLRKLKQEYGNNLLRLLYLTSGIM